MGDFSKNVIDWMSHAANFSAFCKCLNTIDDPLLYRGILYHVTLTNNKEIEHSIKNEEFFSTNDHYLIIFVVYKQNKMLSVVQTFLIS